MNKQESKNNVLKDKIETLTNEKSIENEVETLKDFKHTIKK